MADEVLLKILKQGADAWNKARRGSYTMGPAVFENTRTGNILRIGFVPANLAEAELSGADLKNFLLSKANLSRANLKKADLQGTDLSNADLSGADLSGATLMGKSNKHRINSSVAIFIQE
jgi:uncharacterized protein YjbI with pentapeptide repeats